MARISIVQDMNIINITLSSTLLTGDIVEVKPKSLVFSVQRELPSYLSDEGSFRYPLFFKPIPQPVVYENMTMNIKNSNPLIMVRDIEIISISASSLLQIGSNQRIDAESRNKNIRQLTGKGITKGTQSVQTE